MPANDANFGGRAKAPFAPCRKSVDAENRFSTDLNDFDAMVVELESLVDKVWRYCEGAGNRGRTARLKLKFNDFEIITRKPISPRRGSEPIRQFERLRPVEGLDVIASLFTSPEETWEWLVSPNRMTSGKPPIDKLRDGDLPLVRSAAGGAFDYATP